MRKALNIAIIGCGTAGQASAIFLARAGHTVTIFERAPFLGPVGAGLLLQPTGMAVLARLGVADQIRALGARIERLHGITADHRPVLDIRYADLRPDLQGIGIHRGALFSTLQSRVETSGSRILTNHDIRAISDRSLIDSRGRAHGPFDLIVVADGARCPLRAASGLVARDRTYPWGALWFVGEMPASGFDATLSQVYRGTREMIGFLPSGRVTPNDPSPTISVFSSIRLSDIAAIRSAGLDAWKSRVLSLAPHAEPIVSQVRDISQLIVAEYRNVVLRHFHAGHTIFLGDAAHAMSPQLGQGANLALLDAAALADALASTADIPTALHATSQARHRSTRFYQMASRWLTPWFQSDHSWMAWPRDAFGASLCDIEWYRDQMLLSLVGVKTGILTASPLPAPHPPPY